MNLHQLFEAIRVPYEAGDYEAALSILEREGHLVAGHSSRVAFWKMCMHSLAGRPEVALALLIDTVGSGDPVSEWALLNDPDLIAARELPGWAAVVEANRALIDSQPAAAPTLYLAEPQGPGPHPLVIALHGNFSHPDLELGFWAEAARLGWLAALPFSTQREERNAGLWNDLDLAGREVRAHYEHLRASGRIDIGRVTLAGFSRGGMAALHLLLHGLIPARGLVLVNAVVPAEALVEWESLFPQAARLGRRLILLAGENSARDLESAARLEAACIHAGLKVQVQRVPGLGHAYPSDMAARLPALLAWIEGQG